MKLSYRIGHGPSGDRTARKRWDALVGRIACWDLDRQLAETGTVRSAHEVQNQMINTARSGGFRPGHVEIQDA